MSKSDVQSDFMNLLCLHQRIAWVVVVPTTLGACGISDIIGQLRDGRAFCIVTKEPGEVPNGQQTSFLNMANDNHGLAFWADSAEKVALELTT